ncbi:helix-turn-helix Psq domain [Phytophthora infestans]|nr:helix-turn-helix Psq domain [Phytophthora infestans]
MNLHHRDLSSACVRRYLSEADEKEALRKLMEKLRHQKRITSDDVRMEIRTVASQGGAVALPLDFPPSGWVLEFKRVHGFMYFNNFVFGAASSRSRSGVEAAAAFGLPARLEVAPLRSAVAPTNNTYTTTITPTANPTNMNSNNSSSSTTAHARGNTTEGDKETSKDRNGSRSSKPAHAVMSSMPPPGPRARFNNEIQRNFSQRHQQHLQQQQRRAILVDGHRRAAAWSMPLRDSSGGDEEMRLNASTSSSENDATTDPSNSPRGERDGDVGPALGVETSSTQPSSQHAVSNNASSMEEMQDTTSDASSYNDNRGYKLSHTVSAETWEKAIAAVEQQGMSLRAAAKLYGVHFAALHRRVKKRAQAVHAKGTSDYFHPSDEAGIMRVVVARAELGVLMTFDELMRLVESAALRKLPDISMDSARKLLTRFQSRNEQSVRHIIEDWPPSLPAVDVSSTEGIRPPYRPYLEHPGFDFGPKPPVIRRPQSVGASAAAMAAAAKTSLFVPPTHLGPPSSSVKGRVNDTRRSKVRFVDGAMTLDDGQLPNGRLHFMGPRARSEGDGDAVMVV